MNATRLVLTHAHVLLLILGLLLSGCVAQSGASLEATGEDTTRRPAVVVAVIDTGSSPYLPIFASTGQTPPEGIGYDTVLLTQEGTLEERTDADDAMLMGLRSRTLYHFAGTRLMAIGFTDDTHPYPQTFDTNRHGVSTTYLVAREAPAAIIVSVQVSTRLCARDAETSCSVDASVAEAMEWVASQPWIDIVSSSLGTFANHPDHAALHPEMERYLRASETAALSGKLIVNAAGNVPVPSATDYFTRAPWVIAAGGTENDGSGASLLSAKLVDVSANFTELVPVNNRFDMEVRSGTSGSAPIIAGTLANALHLIRAAGVTDATAQQLRDALNASAIMHGPTDWTPPATTDPGQLHTPILVQPQVGWGYVDGSLAPEIARRVIEGDLAPPAGKEQAAAFQPAWQRAREEFWSGYS